LGEGGREHAPATTASTHATTASTWHSADVDVDMPATARKPSAAASPKKRPANPRKAEPAKRSIARVNEVDGAIAVLANDPEFQK